MQGRTDRGTEDISGLVLATWSSSLSLAGPASQPASQPPLPLLSSFVMDLVRATHI